MPRGELAMGPIHDESDESLAGRAFSDEAAMIELYRRYRPLIDKQCRLNLSSREDAEDVASQVFQKVWDALSHQQRIDHFRPWIFTITHHTIVNMYRSRKPQSNIDDFEFFLDSGKSPENIALDNEEMRRLRDCIRNLPEPQRQVVELRLFGMINPEICMLLGKTYSWVGSTQHRAMKQLKNCISRGEDLVMQR